MSRQAASGADTGAGIKAVAGVVFVLAMAVVVLLMVRARPAPEPFDPRSGRDDGARGLVVTLESVGAEVTVARSLAEFTIDDRVLVLDDRLDATQRDELLDLVEAGAVAVVADPASSLHGGSGLDGGARSIGGGDLPPVRLAAAIEANLLPGDCDLVALDGLRGLVVPDGLLFPVGPDEPRCFTGPAAAGAPDGGATSFVVVRELGAGIVVGLGDNEPFQNRWLRGADNAGLLVALLAPDDGDAVTILVGNGAAPTVDDVGSGDETLRDLVPAWVWMVMAAAALAFLVLAVSRATRLGRVLDEPVATPIDGSELVAATGNLLERSGDAASAGRRLQHRLHRDLCAAHGVRLDAPFGELDRTVADRAGGVEPGSVERVLRADSPTDAALVALAVDVRTIRRSVFDEPTATPPPGDPISSDNHHREVAAP